MNTEHNHPNAIFIQLTTRCNAMCINCPHPFTYRTIHKKGSMNDDTWETIVQSLIKNNYKGQVGLYLHHEQLLAPKLFNKIDDINNKTNAFVVLSTNGNLLNEDIQKKLIESPPKTLHININSADKMQYENMTKLNYDSVINNTIQFIDIASKKIDIQINCPVLQNVDTDKLKKLFPTIQVNTNFYANSRGGLLKNISAKNFNSRFKSDKHCIQPKTNFNILFDGSVILCCQDWMHESKKDFDNILNKDIFDIYQYSMLKIQNHFFHGKYNIYKMCTHCSKEMGFSLNTNYFEIIRNKTKNIFTKLLSKD